MTYTEQMMTRDRKNSQKQLNRYRTKKLIAAALNFLKRWDKERGVFIAIGVAGLMTQAYA